MEFFQDWKFYLFVVTIIGIAINWVSNYKIMNNHLHHLSLDLKEIKEKQDDQGEKISNIQSEIAFIKGTKNIK